MALARIAEPRFSERIAQKLACTAWAFAMAGQRKGARFAAWRGRRSHANGLNAQNLTGTAWALALAGQPKEAHLKCVQGLKAIHQFVQDGHWAAAIRLTDVTDPYNRAKSSADDCELEAVLGELKIEEDLKKRSKLIAEGEKEKAV